jgi:hypothetical protein
MTFWQRLWRVQLAGLISLAAFAAFVAILFVIEGLLVSPRETDVIEVFLLVVAFGIFYGILPAVLLGAPVYTAMVSRGRIRWSLLLIVVLFPGAAMLFHHRGLGIVGIVAGPSILFMTHKLYQRWSSHED